MLSLAAQYKIQETESTSAVAQALKAALAKKQGK